MTPLHPTAVSASAGRDGSPYSRATRGNLDVTTAVAS